MLPLLLLACAPMYRPHPVHSPMLDQAGDLQIAGAATLTGGQLGAAWAASDHLGLRGEAQFDGLSGPYGLVSGGAGYHRASPGGLRLGLWLDMGGGYGQSIQTTTFDGSTSTTRLSGAVAQAAASAELGWEGRSAALGAELRGVQHLVLHDARSGETGTGWLSSAELLTLLRLGPGPLRFQAFAGLSLPFLGDGTTGVQIPILLGLGLTWDTTAGAAGG